MLINGAKNWLKDRVRSQYAQQLLRVGELTLRAKMIVAGLVIVVFMALIGSIVMMVHAVVSAPVVAAAQFLSLVNPFDDGDEESGGGDSDQYQCFSNAADPSFTDLVLSVPEGAPLDVATGWLIYAAPHHGTEAEATSLTYDEFIMAWSQVITGTFTGTSSNDVLVDPETGYAVPAPAIAYSQPTTILGVVAVIDPTFDYSSYAEQAYIASVYLLGTDHLADADDEVYEQMFTGMLDACEDGAPLPAPPLMDRFGG